MPLRLRQVLLGDLAGLESIDNVIDLATHNSSLKDRIDENFKANKKVARLDFDNVYLRFLCCGNIIFFIFIGLYIQHQIFLYA